MFIIVKMQENLSSAPVILFQTGMQGRLLENYSLINKQYRVWDEPKVNYKTLEQHHECRSGVFIVNLSKCHTLF